MKTLETLRGSLTRRYEIEQTTGSAIGAGIPAGWGRTVLDY